MDNGRITLAGIGCGSRTRTYMKLAMEYPEKFRIVAAADPVTVRAEQVRDFAPEEERSSIRLFENADALLSQPKMADVAIIGTQDDYHFEPAKRALELGYDLLLEKPISKTLRETLELRDLAEKLGRRVAICHVLRYTPFYNTIRNIIRSGELGEIMTFNANEGVGAWHFGHSFVRGHWGNSAKSTPMIVAKCCHDMDILYWLLNRPCEQVSSFGELSFFRKETLTEPRPVRCTDWTTPIGEDPWDARKYITDDSCRRWLKMVMDGVDEATPEQITEWLKTSPWGRDAFQCEDNDQPDHLVAILRYMGGITGTFTMTAFEEGRHIEIYGTKAKLRAGAFYKENGPGEITITEHFSKKMRKVEIEEAAGGYAGHGGGDWGLVSNLYNDMRVVEDTSLMTTPIQASAHSHVIAFAVEHARRTGEVVDIKEFERRVLAGELNY